MNKVKRAGLMLGIILGLAPAVIVMVPSGCTTSQQAATYKTISGLETTTDNAMKAYFDLVVAGKVSTNTVPTISADYNTFQLAARAAIALAGSSNAPAPQAVVDASAKVVADIGQAK